MKSSTKSIVQQDVYKNNRLNFYKRFEASEIQGKVWTEKLNKVLQLNSIQKSIQLFKLSGFQKINLLSTDIVTAIYNFTNNQVSDKEIDYILSSLDVEQIDVSRTAHKDRDQLKIFTHSLGTITVQAITSVFPNAEIVYPDLHNGLRLGNCHQGSIDIATDILKDVPCKVVTGACFVAHPKQTFLHSWVETTINGTEKVLDYVNNAIFDKPIYYKLFNPTVYERIDNSTLINEMPKIKKLRKADWRLLKLYLSSREEALSLMDSNNNFLSDSPVELDM